MTVHIGTSGWSYGHWTNVLYPEGLPPERRLDHYVRQFQTVELNASDYRWPSDSAFASWQRRLPDGFIVTVKAPGQPVRNLRVNATPILGVDGRRQGAWAVMTDVTSLVAAARGELSRSLAETVNHDLRTPLTTMLGHAELLIDQQEVFPPDAVRSLDAVWRAGQRLNDVVTWISDWIDLAYATERDGKGRSAGGLAEYLEHRHRP